MDRGEVDPLSSAPCLTYMSINLYNLPGNSVAFTSIPTYQLASAECDVIHHSTLYHKNTFTTGITQNLFKLV